MTVNQEHEQEGEYRRDWENREKCAGHRQQLPRGAFQAPPFTVGLTWDLLSACVYISGVTLIERGNRRFLCSYSSCRSLAGGMGDRSLALMTQVAEDFLRLECP